MQEVLVIALNYVSAWDCIPNKISMLPVSSNNDLHLKLIVAHNWKFPNMPPNCCASVACVLTLDED
jgi:hypothetical protein